MQLLLVILLISFSVFLLYQDYNDRQIHIAPLIIFICLAAYLQFENNLFFKVFALESLLNIFLLAIVLFSVLLYSRFIVKKSFLSMIGIGDIILFIAFALGYESTEFVIHFTLAMIFSLLIHLIMKSYYKIHKTVPLAGYMAVFLSFDKTLSFTGLI